MRTYELAPIASLIELELITKQIELTKGLGELSLFHSYSDAPVDESSHGVHKIELVVDSGENFGDGSRVGDHAATSHSFTSIGFGGIAPGHFGLDNTARKATF